MTVKGWLRAEESQAEGLACDGDHFPDVDAYLTR